MRRECYICHELVKDYKYTRHVRSHLASNVTETRPQPNPYLSSLIPSALSYDNPNYQCGTVFSPQSTPPPSRACTPLDGDDRIHSAISDSDLVSAQITPFPGRLHRQETPKGRPTGLNAFQAWLKNPTRNFAEYTTIDGQVNKPDSQAQFRQAAKILRQTTKEEIIGIVNEFGNFSHANEKKTCVALVQKAPIFPGLVAYTYTHLSVCPHHGWLHKDDWSNLVDKLKRLVDSWAKSGDVACILSCRSIKDMLLNVLRSARVQPEEHKCNSALLNGSMVSNYDILNLAALSALCVTGPQKNDILDQRGTQVKVLVELFHDLLEADVELEGKYRRHLLNPLIQFSKNSGYTPHGIDLEEHAICRLVPVSQGGFGVIHKGKFGDRLVAVKFLKQDDDMSLPEYNKQVSKEAIVWRHLRHPNCLPLYGVYRMSPDGEDMSVALVSPWMDQGTLFQYLKHNPEANRTQLVLDVVRGINYLHLMQPHVAHRDIKPDNILITRKGRACLADFGLASIFDTDKHFHTAPSQITMAGTYNYMAPEIFNAEDREARRKVNKRACDMYALGCTIYAAYSGRHPFGQISLTKLQDNVISGQRPEFPQGKISPDMWSFVENLWGPDPSKRLTAEMAVSWMETKARQEGADASLAPLEEEWKWKGPRGDKCLWSVPL